jgi:hypothetical protein
MASFRFGLSDDLSSTNLLSEPSDPSGVEIANRIIDFTSYDFEAVPVE